MAGSAQTIRGEWGGGALPRPVSSGEPLAAATHHLVARKSGGKGLRRSVVWGGRPPPPPPASSPPTPRSASHAEALARCHEPRSGVGGGRPPPLTPLARRQLQPSPSTRPERAKRKR